MPLKFKELEEKARRSGVASDAALIKKAGKLQGRTVITSVIRCEDLSVPALVLVCPESDMDYFKIKEPMPQPDFRFRLIRTTVASVIEIPLLFSRFTWGKQLILNLDPAASAVKKFLRGCAEQEAISFTYFCHETGIIAYSFTDLSGEHLEWVKRNCDHAACECSDPDAAFAISSESLAREFKANQRFYRFGEKSGKPRKGGRDGVVLSLKMSGGGSRFP